MSFSYLRKLTPLALLTSSAAVEGSVVFGRAAPSCPNPQLSCQNTTAVANTCCFNAPGGQLLQTQFWDTNPPTGPSNSWTVHGLWPDHCDGTYDANCDATRAYTNITAILSAAGANDLLSYMNAYWKDYQGNDESFWEHEWGKHGTCISTLKPSCYTNYVPQQEVVQYFQKTVDLFKTLPSYTWLANAGIVPSASATYTSSAVLAALKAPRGVDVSIQCTSAGELDEIWYFYNVKGSVQDGTFVPVNPDGSKSSCPATGIKYLPKSGGGGTSPSPTASTPAPTPTGTYFTGKGTLQVTNAGASKGCIISGGTWYTTGTCATFTAAAATGGFTLTSSKGKCGIQNNNLVCGTGISTATVFTASGDKLVDPSGGNNWYAASIPSGSTQVAVSTAQAANSLTISWVAA